jgi:hypothetical protein
MRADGSDCGGKEAWRAVVALVKCRTQGDTHFGIGFVVVKEVRVGGQERWLYLMGVRYR